MNKTINGFSVMLESLATRQQTFTQKKAINTPEASPIQICSLSDIMGVIQSLPLKQWQHRCRALSQTKLNEI